MEYKTLYGDGKAAIRAMNFMKKYDDVPSEQIIVKKFVKRLWN